MLIKTESRPALANQYKDWRDSFFLSTDAIRGRKEILSQTRMV